jgi:hypothetical protein
MSGGIGEQFRLLVRWNEEVSHGGHGGLGGEILENDFSFGIVGDRPTSPFPEYAQNSCSLILPFQREADWSSELFRSKVRRQVSK